MAPIPWPLAEQPLSPPLTFPEQPLLGDFDTLKSICEFIWVLTDVCAKVFCFSVKVCCTLATFFFAVQELNNALCFSVI